MQFVLRHAHLTCNLLLVNVADIQVEYEKAPSADELISILRSKGYSVTEWQRDATTLHHLDENTVQIIAIFIGSGVATALVHSITTDIYNTAKKWAMTIKRRNESVAEEARRVKGRNVYAIPYQEGPIRITIYGPDGEQLASLELPGRAGYHVVMEPTDSGRGKSSFRKLFGLD